MGFVISYDKMIRVPEKENLTYRSKQALNVAIRLDLDHDHDLGFSRSIFRYQYLTNGRLDATKR